jgi:broad specificity phosphatase PhoE
MAPPNSLLLVRHAEVEPRYHRVFSGRLDVELSQEGHRQAQALSGYLDTRNLHVVYASPMRRVRQTLKPFLTKEAPKHVELPNLREVDFGDWTGLTWEEILPRFRVSAFRWLDQLESAAIPNGECASTLKRRIEPCLAQALEQHKGENVAIVCHGGVIRVLLSILLDLPLPKTSVFEVDYASVTQMGFLEGKAVLQLLNYTPWR